MFGVCCGPPKPPKLEPEEEEEEEEEDDDPPAIGDFPIDFQEINTNCGKRNGYKHEFRIINGQVGKEAACPTGF